MIEKFTFELASPKVREKLVLVKAESEHRAHVVLKVLSYLLFYRTSFVRFISVYP